MAGTEVLSLRDKLVESDPGLLRFRQALKSVVAVALAVAVFSRASGVITLFAGISAAFLMQCVDSGSRRRQQASMAATAGAMMIMAPIASALHGHRAAETALLVCWAAAVFYARRFLQGNGAFTLFAFTEVLLASALPGNPTGQFQTAAVGFVIAFFMRFWVWPPDEARAFCDAVRFFNRRAAHIANAANHDSADLERLHAAVVFGQNLLAEHSELQPEGVYQRLVSRQFDALQSLRMLHEARSRAAGTDESGDCAAVRDSIRDLAVCRLVEIAAELRADLQRLDRGGR